MEFSNLLQILEIMRVVVENPISKYKVPLWLVYCIRGTVHEAAGLLDLSCSMALTGTIPME